MTEKCAWGLKVHGSRNLWVCCTTFIIGKDGRLKHVMNKVNTRPSRGRDGAGKGNWACKCAPIPTNTLRYLFDDAAPGQLREIAPGYSGCVCLPMALDHINLYLLEDEDGWWIIDTGIAVGPTQDLWEQVTAEALGDKPVKAVLSTALPPRSHRHGRLVVRALAGAGFT